MIGNGPTLPRDVVLGTDSELRRGLAGHLEQIGAERQTGQQESGGDCR